ncbi:hypothetical protein ACQP0C_12300 [Nocardia sp. CA-129566]|uniref:hypothetical protein n=1 Tax=Nocardia sp. CA-129566 TaxID=3239976 RepID=UPI003D98A9B0
MRGLGRVLERILAAVVADPRARIGGIDILDADERGEVLTAGTAQSDAATGGTELTHLLTSGKCRVRRRVVEWSVGEGEP